MKIIPAIDIIEARTVRLEKGDYNKKLSYDLTPADAAKEWESCGAEFLHIIDLDGAKQGYPVNIDTAAGIVKNINIPAEIGGGYRTKEDIQKALDAGLSRVIVGSSAVKDLRFADEIIKEYGDKVIISVDVLEGKVKVHGWEGDAKYTLSDIVSKLKISGAERIIFTDISKDGTLSGPDILMIESILRSEGIKLIYAGGVKNTDHIKQLNTLSELGLEGVIIGRALYDGTIDLKEAIRACKTDNTVS